MAVGRWVEGEFYFSYLKYPHKHANYAIFLMLAYCSISVLHRQSSLKPHHSINQSVGLGRSGWRYVIRYP